MGRMSEVVKLVAITVTEDELHVKHKTPTERTVFGEELAVYSSTFWSAAAAGLKPAKMFEIWRREYDGEERLIHDGVTYRVMRTEVSQKNPERLRLTCERVTGNG